MRPSAKGSCEPRGGGKQQLEHAGRVLEPARRRLQAEDRGERAGAIEHRCRDRVDVELALAEHGGVPALADSCHLQCERLAVGDRVGGERDEIALAGQAPATQLIQPPAEPPTAGDAGKCFAGWCLDLQTYQLTSPQGELQRLTKDEFQLLAAFVQRPQWVLSRDYLLDQIRNRDWTPNDRTIDVLVGRLRRKLNDDPADPQLIITVHGRGYLFAVPVTTRPVPPTGIA